MSEKKNTLWVWVTLTLFIGVIIGMQLPSKSRLAIRPSAIEPIKQLILKSYVDSLDPKQLDIAAVEGMMNALDLHSTYVPPVEAKELEDDLQGHFEGIGVQFRVIEDTVTVLMPISGGPSEKLGVMAGDKIIRVDDTLIAGVGMSTEAIMKRLKGPKGSQVNIRVQRSGLSKLLSFDIVRDVIPTYSVDVAFMVDQQIGYIMLSKFSATTALEIEQALLELKSKGMQRLILDLRGNGGGFLMESIKVADQFLSSGKSIVYTEGVHHPREEALATAYGLFEKEPIVVLIDQWSASASEIIAGALQDNDRATIVGRRSYGKGLVQTPIGLSNGATLRLTVARYHTPSGRCIQRPFKLGDKNTEEDLVARYLSGEWLSVDSIHLDSTLSYQTLGGRTVYGGGGIMPDVYVPYRTDARSVFINKVFNSGEVLRFSFTYADQNRKLFKSKYPDPESFVEHFQVDALLMNRLYEHLSSKLAWVKRAEFSEHQEEIRNLLRSYIARDLFDNRGFYPIYIHSDTDVQKALELIRGM